MKSLMSKIKKVFNRNNFKMYLIRFKMKIHLQEKARTKVIIKIKDLTQILNIKILRKIIKIVSKENHRNRTKLIRNLKTEKGDDEIFLIMI